MLINSLVTRGGGGGNVPLRATLPLHSSGMSCRRGLTPFLSNRDSSKLLRRVSRQNAFKCHVPSWNLEARTCPDSSWEWVFVNQNGDHVGFCMMGQKCNPNPLASKWLKW